MRGLEGVWRGENGVHYDTKPDEKNNPALHGFVLYDSFWI